MMLYKGKGDSLELIKEKPFKLEKDIQSFVEGNLEKLYGLEFVATERVVGGLRIDTLAFDPQLKSFVIIEYKRNSSFSVVDQGFSYLSLLLNNKSDFVLEYNELKDKTLKRGDIDWDQVKIIFIARSFTAHQVNAVNFKNIAFELWEVTRFDNDVISFNQIDQNKDSASVPSLDNKDTEVKKYIKDKEEYSEERLIRNKKIGDMYEQIKEYVSEFGSDMRFVPMKSYIGIQKKGNWRVIVYINLFTDKIRLSFTRTTPTDLSDPEGKLRDEGNAENKGQQISSYEITHGEDVEYGLFLIKQAINRFEDEFVK